MNTEKETLVNLIPVIEITKNTNALEGKITIEELTVFSGYFSIDDNKCSLEETFEIPIQEFEFNKINYTYSLKLNIPSQLKATIKNIGLFLKKSQDSDRNRLIAYASLDESIDTTNNLTLHLAVPPFGKSDRNSLPINPENLSTNTHDPVAIKISRSYWEKMKFGWNEEYIGQEEFKPGKFFINSEVFNVAVAHNGNSSLYLLYQSENGELVYMGIYELSLKKTIRTHFTTTLDNGKGDVRNAIFTDTRKRERVRCFISHEQGVYCVDISLRDLSGSHQEVYSAPARVSKSTLANFGGYPYLAGGTLGHITDGKHNAATGTIGTNPLIPVWHMWEPRNNPIVEYFNNHLYYIGGNIVTHEKKVIETKLARVPARHLFLDTSRIELHLNIYPNPSNEKQLLSVNAVSHAHCRVGHKIYIFPRNLFQQRNSSFYIYDTAANSISLEKPSSHIVDKVQNQNLRDYHDFQVVAISNTIFFVLTKSSHTTLDTQILYWETI